VPTVFNASTSTFAPSLTPGANVTIVLSPYFVFYDLVQTRIPSLDDYAELGSFTSDYLDIYFQVALKSTPEIQYQSSATMVSGSQFRLGQPVEVDYTTTMDFAGTSMIIPTKEELNMILAGAFEGNNALMYVSPLAAGLASSNIFSTTMSITFEVAPETLSPDANSTNSGTSSSARNKTSGSPHRSEIAAVSSAAAFLVVLAGLAFAKKRRVEYNYDKKINLMEHMTVAEETLASDMATTASCRSHRYDGEAVPTAPATIEWGELSSTTTTTTSPLRRYRIISRNESKYVVSALDESDEEGNELPEQRRKQLDDVTL
jgi:hypothetical protein